MTGRSVNINPKKQIFVKRTGEELGRAGFVFSGNMFQNEHMFFGSNSVFITSFFRSTEKMKIISNPRQSAQSVAKSSSFVYPRSASGVMPPKRMVANIFVVLLEEYAGADGVAAAELQFRGAAVSLLFKILQQAISCASEYTPPGGELIPEVDPRVHPEQALPVRAAAAGQVPVAVRK
ncbi:MAG: hypothetical protein WCJ02_17630, partial [bacterium]